jgi:hypothetical protein
MLPSLMARNSIDVGQIFCKSDDHSRRRWQVIGLYAHPDGPHAQLVRLDDPTRRITLSVDALLDRRLMRRQADEPAPTDVDWLPRATWVPAAAGE